MAFLGTHRDFCGCASARLVTLNENEIRLEGEFRLTVFDHDSQPFELVFSPHEKFVRIGERRWALRETHHRRSCFDGDLTVFLCAVPSGDVVFFPDILIKGTPPEPKRPSQSSSTTNWAALRAAFDRVCAAAFR